ncbi:MAG: RNA polymerase sigma factor [Planctomycetota bacterium]
MSDRTDLELVAACREGDEEAWAELIGNYSALIASVPRRYGLAEHLVEEVFAEVCAILFRSLGGIRDAQALPSWVVRTTTRTTWEIARKAKRAWSPELPELTGAAPPDEVVSAFEEEQIVRRALRAISEKCQRLLRLLYFEPASLSYDEVARRLGVPRGSLGPTRRRCLDRLRSKLPSHLGGDVSGKGGSPS